MLDHRELETLVAIIDGQSFENAARVLNISAGAVSQRIKSLENRVGSSVLIRSMPPRTTASGTQVLSYARRILLLHNEMNVALQHTIGFGSLPLTIAVNQDSLSCWFLDVIQHFQDDPNLSFDIRTSNTVETQERLKNGDVVAAITSKNNQVAGCKTRYLGKLDYLPVCSPSFFEVHFKPSPCKASLISAPTVVYDRDDDLVDRYLARFDVHKQKIKTHYIPSSDVLRDAVKQGIGWTMLPRLLVQSELANSSLIIMDTDPMYVDLYWNTWDQISTSIAEVEKQVLSVAEYKLVQ